MDSNIEFYVVLYMDKFKKQDFYLIVKNILMHLEEFSMTRSDTKTGSSKLKNLNPETDQDKCFESKYSKFI